MAARKKLIRWKIIFYLFKIEFVTHPKNRGNYVLKKNLTYKI